MARRSRRYGPGAEPGLSHPSLRSHHRRRRRAPCPSGPGDDFFAGCDGRHPRLLAAAEAAVPQLPGNPTTESVDCRSSSVSSTSRASTDLGRPRPRLRGPRLRRLRAPSILEMPGAKDIAVEFFTLSKSYNMPGWRVGFMVGNRDLVEALARLKSYFDYGTFTPIQVAAIAALEGPQDCVDEIRETYRKRRNVSCDGLNSIGWPVERPRGDDVRLGADPGALPPRWDRWSSRRSCSCEAKVAVSPASVSATTAMASYVSRSSRTSTVPARRSAGSATCSRRIGPSRSKAPRSSRKNRRERRAGRVPPERRNRSVC